MMDVDKVNSGVCGQGEENVLLSRTKAVWSREIGRVDT